MYTRPLVLFFFLSLAALSFAQVSTTKGCANGKTPVSCLIDPCFRATCPNYPLAVCSADYCSGNCDTLTWKIGEKVIDCSKPSVSPCAQPVNCFADPCSVTKCPNHPNAKCVANYCSGGCDAVFIENGNVVTDCETPQANSCLGKCSGKVPAPVCKLPQTPQLTYCGPSANDATVCEWKTECSGKCCIADLGQPGDFNCSERSLTNSDWCGEGSTCCLTSDALGENAHSYSCCPKGTACVRNPVPTRGGGHFCAPIDTPCVGVTCPTGQVCKNDNGVPFCANVTISIDACAVTLCITGTVCKVDSTGKAVCVPKEVSTNPCATVRCAAGYICVANKDGTAGCVPTTGKPGECPVPSSFGTCVSECGSDLQCNGTKKCCRNGCGAVCVEPVKGTVKPGSCPVVKDTGVVDICLVSCEADSDCEGDLKCCGANCRRQCVKPAGNTCTSCPPTLLSTSLVAPKPCPDGTTGGWTCNKETCAWEFKECKCDCDLTAFAANVATSAIDSKSVSICLASVAQYDATTKTAAAGAATTTSTSVSAEYLSKCYGSGTCELVGDKCVASWGCGSCLPIPAPPKCIRAGCQREKCVAPGDPITKECAAPSHALGCLDKAICDVDSTGKCGWTYTEEHKKCVANPIDDAKVCATTDSCKCSADPNCFWCSSRYRTLDLNIVAAGRCLSKSLMKKCLAPVELDGFAGNVLDSVTGCKVAAGDLDVVINQKDPITVDIKIAEEIGKKPDLSGIKVRIESILTPEKLKSSTDGGVSRTIVVIDPKPTDVQRPILCKLIADSLLSSTSKVFVAANCKFTEVETSADASASSSVKRQASSGATYLHEAEASTSPQSAASGIPRDFVISMVFLAIGLFFAW